MMKVFGLAAGLMVAAGMAMADPAEGMWKTQVDDGAYAHVDMYKCGANFCGKIVRTFNSEGEYESPNKGKVLVQNMAPQGDGYYAGKVWRPSNDKIYVGKMEINGNQLKLKGCVAGGLLCSSQTWTRIE